MNKDQSVRDGIILIVIGALLLLFTALAGLNPTGYVIQENFNLEVELPNSYKTTAPGEEIWFTTKLLSLSNAQRVDITLEYQIASNEGETIVSKSETVAVETQASFVGSLKIPEDVSEGDYVLRILLISEAEDIESAQTEISFSIKKEVINPQVYYYGGILVLLFALGVFIALRGKKIAKHMRIRSQVKKIVKTRLK